MIDSIHSNGMPVPPERSPIEETGKDNRVDAAGAGHGHQQSEAARDQIDRVELSDAARRLANETGDAAGEVTESSTLSPERLSTVTKRLSEGFYDNEAVRHEITRQLMPDLRTHTGE